MRYLKMLGFAAVAAMALMAFLGAGTASATKLCKTTDTPHCSVGWHYPVGTGIDFSLKPGTKIKKKSTGGVIEDECSETTIKAVTTNTGSENETVDGEVTAANLTWGGCTAEKTETIAGGLLEIHWIPGTHDGTVTARNFKWTVKKFGMSCTLSVGAGTDLGTLTSGTEPILDVNTVVEGGGGVFCPSSVIVTATFVVTSPQPLYVTTG